MKMTPASRLREWKAPVLSTGEHQQTAALCLRQGPEGPEVLLVSSLQTRRWILPKGWPMEGHSIASSALHEAWEEAGVTGTVSVGAIGSYGYQKIRKGGEPIPCRVAVFRVDVTELADSYPEQSKRMRHWVSLKKAAELVQEPELKALFLSL
jgi:8-oxo-dGTP pyrophosphatase MutT (NUDIX family)